jgi:hypothetical protein
MFFSMSWKRLASRIKGSCAGGIAFHPSKTAKGGLPADNSDDGAESPRCHPEVRVFAGRRIGAIGRELRRSFASLGMTTWGLGRAARPLRIVSVLVLSSLRGKSGTGKHGDCLEFQSRVCCVSKLLRYLAGFSGARVPQRTNEPHDERYTWYGPDHGDTHSRAVSQPAPRISA